MTPALLCLLHAVRTLRIDCFFGAMGPVVCTTVLNSMARRSTTARLLHMALHRLPLRPDDPQLVAAVQAQSQLVVRLLKLTVCSQQIVAALGLTVLGLMCTSCCYWMQNWMQNVDHTCTGMCAGLRPACSYCLRQSHRNRADGGRRLQHAAAAARGDRGPMRLGRGTSAAHGVHPEQPGGARVPHSP